MRRVSVRTVPTFSAWAFPMPMEPDPVTLIDHEDGRGWQTEDGMILDEQMNLMAEICYLNSTLNEESGERAKLLLDVWCMSKQLSTESLKVLATTATTLRG